MDVPVDGSGGELDGLLDPPTSSAFNAAASSQDMIMGDIAVEAEPEHKRTNGPSANCDEEAMICARCNMPGSDLRLLPCNCTLHARCFPLSLLSEHAASMGKQSLSLSGQHQFCYFCQTRFPYIESNNGTPIESIQILSLRFDSLEQAGELRYQEEQQDQSEKSRVNGKRKASGSETTASPSPSPPSSEGNLLGLVSTDDIDMDKKALATAVPFLGIAHHGNGRTSSVKNESSSSSAPSYRAANIDHRRRTGRWTAAETAYVDYIVECFEAGTLPLPQGVKLNEFLSDALMCKPSRLTKKMKSAKLSMRSFAFGKWTMDDGSDVAKCAELSKLEGEFLNSINSEYLRLEAKFNLQRMWRTHFWNLCLQIRFNSLDIATEWLPSLEEMELRGGQAEEVVRRAERRRMGLALKQDARSSCGLSGVFIGGIPGTEGAEAQSRDLMMDSPLTEADASPAPQAAFSSTATYSAKSNWLSFGGSGGRPRSDSTTIPVSRSRSGSIAAPSFPSVSPSELSTTGPKSRAGPSSNHNLPASTTTQAELEFLNEIFSSEGTGFADPFDANTRLNTAKSGAMTDTNSASFAKVAPSNGTSMPSLVSMESIQQSHADDNSFDDGLSISSGGAYLDAIVKFLQDTKAPFQTAECWVPSFLPSDAYDGTDSCEAASSNGGGARAATQPQDIQHLRLCYAGNAIRSDAASARNLAAFGEYSSHFSFSPGEGVPGRVYSTNLPSWESDIQVTAPDYFKRVGGAKIYGVRTLAAFPVASPSVGRIVVVLYSTLNVQRDVTMAKKILVELQRHRPDPHWRLVVDVGRASTDSARAAELASSSMSIEQGRQTSPSPMTVDGPESSSMSTTDGDEERDMISLLGDHIPTDSGPDDLVAQSMMSLRILLLRSRSKRSESENDVLDVIKRSYRDYRRCSLSRSRREIAHLVARDWSFLAPRTQEDASISRPAAGAKEATEGIGVPTEPGTKKPAYHASLVTPRSGVHSVNSSNSESKPSAVGTMKAEPAPANQSRVDVIRNDLSLAKGPSSGERRCRAISTLSNLSAGTSSSAKICLNSYDHSPHSAKKAPPPPPPL